MDAIRLIKSGSKHDGQSKPFVGFYVTSFSLHYIRALNLVMTVMCMHEAGETTRL